MSTTENLRIDKKQLESFFLARYENIDKFVTDLDGMDAKLLLRKLLNHVKESPVDSALRQALVEAADEYKEDLAYHKALVSQP